MTRRQSLERQIVAIMNRAERTFRHAGTVVVPKVIITTVEDTWMAWREGGFDRAESLIAVTGLLITRESAKFRSNRERYLQRQQELSA